MSEDQIDEAVRQRFGAEYDRLFAWRDRWNRKSNEGRRHGQPRLLRHSEYFQRRSQIADNKIRGLMREVDAFRQEAKNGD